MPRRGTLLTAISSRQPARPWSGFRLRTPTPNPANPFGLNPASSVICPRNGDCQSHLGLVCLGQADSPFAGLQHDGLRRCSACKKRARSQSWNVSWNQTDRADVGKTCERTSTAASSNVSWNQRDSPKTREKAREKNIHNPKPECRMESGR